MEIQLDWYRDKLYLSTESSINEPRATLQPLPIQCNRPEADSSERKTPCDLHLHWTAAHPLRCTSLRLQTRSSARHIEVRIRGLKTSFDGTKEEREVYLGTQRGSKVTSNERHAPQQFNVEMQLQRDNADYSVLDAIYTLSVRFVSLTGNKDEFRLEEFKMNYDPVEAPPEKAQTSSLSSAFAGMNVNAPSSLDRNMLMQVQMIQQKLQQDMEAKFNQLLDAKLAPLMDRLKASEQHLSLLHQQTVHSEASHRTRVSKLEKQFTELQEQVESLRDVDKSNINE